MMELIERLLKLLGENAALYDRLEACGNEERAALEHGNTKMLSAISAEKESLLFNLEKLDKATADVANEVKHALGLPAVSTLQDIANHPKSAKYKTAIIEVRSKLRRSAETNVDINDFNKRLIAASIENVRKFFHFAAKLHDDAQTYSAGKMNARSVPAGSVLKKAY